ncbi:hypothetical protein L2E82_25214 [Cichorium intybus]|uniref:Uncharacterized protein n=1 Tax=Cichorium intybus TaxID=13427 RepID=A0ACB9E3M1_CICIN|nr:hypothetical protein L2E82_25214 [Cichorium intybus]
MDIMVAESNRVVHRMEPTLKNLRTLMIPTAWRFSTLICELAPGVVKMSMRFFVQILSGIPFTLGFVGLELGGIEDILFLQFLQLLALIFLALATDILLRDRVNQNFLATGGKWLNFPEETFLVNVYAPKLSWIKEHYGMSFYH